jgi:uncharacterized protein
MKKEVLFIQGGGQGANVADEKLVNSLRNALGPKYEVRYPKMPNEEHSSYQALKSWIAKELEALHGEVILVGHSVGASIVLKYLSEEKPEQPIAGLFLVASPYWGAEQWQIKEFALRERFVSGLPTGLPIFFYQSRDDEVVPFAHLKMYQEKLPQATFRELDGRGHQLNDDLSEVARDIKR